MTQALCLNCGHRKFGAICECPECHVNSTGDIGLDIAFSDHRMGVETIDEFGAVVRAIHEVCDDPTVCLWSFLTFVSENHPEVLTINLPPEPAERCREVLSLANPPPVVFRESPSARFLREAEERGDPGGDEAPS